MVDSDLRPGYKDPWVGAEDAGMVGIATFVRIA